MDPQRAAFVEGFALQLAQAGMQRMASRVFAALLVAPADGLTARDIADALGVSAASVSTATTYLTRTGLIERTRVPGERVDRYATDGTRWVEATLVETQNLATMNDWLGRGVEAAADDPGAVERLRETQDFFAFLIDELPRLVDRWRLERTPASGR